MGKLENILGKKGEITFKPSLDSPELPCFCYRERDHEGGVIISYNPMEAEKSF